MVFDKSCFYCQKKIYGGGCIEVNSAKSYRIRTNKELKEYLNKRHKIKTSFVIPGLRPFETNKTGFNLVIFPFFVSA